MRLFPWLGNPRDPFKTRMTDYNKTIVNKGDREGLCQTECSLEWPHVLPNTRRYGCSSIRKPLTQMSILYWS